MVWSFLSNAPITLGLMVTFVFNLGSVTDALNDEHALVSIFNRMLDGNRSATIAFTSVILVMLVMIAVSTMVATSRHLYAFGYDRIARISTMHADQIGGIERSFTLGSLAKCTQS